MRRTFDYPERPPRCPKLPFRPYPRKGKLNTPPWNDMIGMFGVHRLGKFATKAAKKQLRAYISLRRGKIGASKFAQRMEEARELWGFVWETQYGPQA